MSALRQRQWRGWAHPRLQRPIFLESSPVVSQFFRKACHVENQSTSSDCWNMPVVEQNASTPHYARVHRGLGSRFQVHNGLETGVSKEKTSLAVSSFLGKTVQACNLRLGVSHENSTNHPQHLGDCNVACRSNLSLRALHTTGILRRTNALQSGNTVDENAVIQKEMDRNFDTNENANNYLKNKVGNSPDQLEFLEEDDSSVEIVEPSIEDLRPRDRPLPPLDRVTIGLDIENQYRVTRKTKWITKQLRFPIMNDVPALLEQWVKTMYPKRSDWLDLLKELSKTENDQTLMFQVIEFALFEDTFEVRSQDLTRLVIKYMNLELYDDVDRLMSTLDSKGFPPDFVVCSLLLDMNCKLKRLDKAREVFDRIRSLDFVPDVTACTELIKLYCEHGDPKAGEEILGEMEKEKLHGSVDTYLALLRGYSQQGKIKEAEGIFTIMNGDVFLKPGIRGEVYSALVDAYVQSNMLPSAVLGLETMLRLGYAPEDNSLSLLIASFEKKNQFERALDVLLKLESLALRPGAKTLTTLIGWFGKMGLIEEAEILFKNIEMKADVPDCAAYASLYTVYARAGLMEKALAILECMEEKKVAIEASAYEHMIISLLDGKQHEEAVSMRDRMTAQGFIVSDTIERALLGDQGLWGVATPSEGQEEKLGSETESFLAGLSKQVEETPQAP